jgi:hypothetical protein
MHRSSDTIGAIAAALAKAQGELSNPEKSLTAIISAPGQRGGERTFRYAPLSSGLEIVRKSLGRQEIAAVQTTAIDSEAGLVRLNTVLAHSSGEWISSEWPVCPVSETGAPHRMGAALTYARRYALFTLVGIAGEDDLDAPDVNGARAPIPSDEAIGTSSAPPHVNGGGPVAIPKAGNGSSRKFRDREPTPVLSPSDSAATREKLIQELSAIPSAERLTEWAYRRLPVKNTLTAEDGEIVEEAFRVRLMGLSAPTAPATPPVAEQPQDNAEVNAASPDTGAANSNLKTEPDDNPRDGSAAIEKNELAFGEPRRSRNKAHLKFVASQACLICGRQPSDPHHLGFVQPRAMGSKVGDEFTVPLCRTHHREVHRFHPETKWWNQFGLDPLAAASSLWAQTRPVRPKFQRRNSGPASDLPGNGPQSISPDASSNRFSETNPIKAHSS